jgi:hypothetical protein
MKITFTCNWCGKSVLASTKWQKESLVRNGYAYCPKECGHKSHAGVSSRTLAATNRKYAEQFSARMKEHNPMHDAATREKVRNTLIQKGSRPKERGGNGRETPIPQAVLMVALRKFNPVAEFVVPTKAGKATGIPNHYKIDIAFPDEKLAVEVDGHSHSVLERQEQDKKKENFLSSLGWTVLRIPNQLVMDHLSETVAFITSKLEAEITAFKEQGAVGGDVNAQGNKTPSEWGVEVIEAGVL